MADQKPTLLDWLGIRAQFDYSKARWIGGLVTLVVILVVLALVLPSLFQFFKAVAGIDKFDGIAERHEAIRNSGLVVAALVGVPFIVWRSIVAQKQVDIAEQGHITDRINKAVDGLGAEKTVRKLVETIRYQKIGTEWKTDEDGNPVPAVRPDGQPIVDRESHEFTQPQLEVRIGAIFALERIARDSLRDHVQIMEILCAYVRENSPRSEEHPCPLGYWRPYRSYSGEKNAGMSEVLLYEHLSNLEKNFQKWTDRGYDENDTGTVDRWVQSIPEPRADIQAAMTVISRRNAAQIRVEQEWIASSVDRIALFDLRHSNLQKISMIGTNLSNALFGGSALDGVDFTYSDMHLVDAAKTTLRGASFKESKLDDVAFHNSSLENAEFMGAELNQCSFALSGVNGTNFDQSRLQEVDFFRAGFEYVQLTSVNAINCRFQRISGTLTSFEKSVFTACIFDEIDNMNHSTTVNASFDGCLFNDLALSEVSISQGGLEKNFGTPSVVLPPDLEYPSDWQDEAADWHKIYSQWIHWRDRNGMLAISQLFRPN